MDESAILDHARWPRIPQRFVREGGLDDYIKECIEYIDRCHQMAKYSVESFKFSELISLLWKRRDWDPCIEHCRVWLSRIPPIPDDCHTGPYFPTFYLSRALQKKGDLDAALKYAKRAVVLSRHIGDLKLEPIKDNFLIQSVSHKSQLLAKQGLFEEAVQEVLSIKDHVVGADMYGHLHTVLAYTYYKQGLTDLALQTVNEAISHLTQECGLPNLRVLATKLKTFILGEVTSSGSGPADADALI